MKTSTKDTMASSLTTFFERLEKLTKSQRIWIYVATLVVILGLSVYFLFWPKYQHIDSLKTQLAQAVQELDKAKQNARELNDWRSKMQQKEAQYKTVMRALPEKEEIPSLLAGISQAGKDSGLEFVLFQPKDESAKEFYAEIPVDIVVSGSYHQVAMFCEKVANLPRIVNVRNIKIAPQQQQAQQAIRGLLSTSCQAVTYKFIESAPSKAPNRPPAARTN